MKEFKLFSVSMKHKTTHEIISLDVWAENVDKATHKLTDIFFGPDGEYYWIGSGPQYSNDEIVTKLVDEQSKEK